MTNAAYRMQVWHNRVHCAALALYMQRVHSTVHERLQVTDVPVCVQIPA